MSIKEIKASIYCSECGYQNIVSSPVEGMEVTCAKCKRSIILRKKSEVSDSKRMVVNHQVSNEVRNDANNLQKPANKEQNLVAANLKMMARIEELENQIFNLHRDNKELQNKITTEVVAAKEGQAKKEDNYPGKNLLEAILLEVKDQKAGQELSQALQRKEADTLYRTINAMMMEIYEIKKELVKLSETSQK